MLDVSAVKRRARYFGAPQAKEHRSRHWAMRGLMAIGFAAHAMVAGAVVPNPRRYGADSGRHTGDESGAQLAVLCDAYRHVGLRLRRAGILFRGHGQALQFADGRGAEQHDDRGRCEHRPSLQDAAPGAASDRSGQVQRDRDCRMGQRHQWLRCGDPLAGRHGLLHPRGLRVHRRVGPERRRLRSGVTAARPQGVEPDPLWHAERQRQRCGGRSTCLATTSSRRRARPYATSPACWEASRWSA